MTASADPSTRFVLAPDAPLLANLGALWAVDPTLAAAIEEQLAQDGYPVEPTRAGPPTVALSAPDGRRLYLHSRHQPLDEARRLIESAEIDRRIVFCVHGLGLGYHVEHLFQHASDEALILVAEPDLRLIRTALEHRDLSKLIQSGRLTFLTTADRADLHVRLDGQQALFAVGFAFIAHGPSLQLQPDFHRKIQELMNEFVGYCRTSLNTLIINSQRTMENIARNIGWYASTPSIVRLKNRHARQPAIIVSAGPSLRNNKHLLHQAAGKAVLIAVQTTLQPLLELGIEPDYVTSLDYHEICTRFFEKLPAQLRTELIAEPKASSAMFGLYPGPLSLLANEFADKLLKEITLSKGGVRSGATVAHLAFYLAEYLGCDPIIFVGQDLGFSDGLCYTPGTSYEDVWRPELGRFCTVEMKQWEHIVRERPILRKIQDHHGRPMYTEERLFAYLQQFERDFASTSARVIDATEGGAKKQGATPMPLIQALREFCAQPLPSVPRDHPGRNMELIAQCAASLEKRRDEAAEIERLSRQTLPLLEEVRDCLDDQAAVNRIIARIDALRAHMQKLDECYDLVMQLTQYTQLVRFRNDRLLAASKATGLERQRRQVARDIANVRGIIDAAGVFQKLMDQVIQNLRP